MDVDIGNLGLQAKTFLRSEEARESSFSTSVSVSVAMLIQFCPPQLGKNKFLLCIVMTCGHCYSSHKRIIHMIYCKEMKIDSFFYPSLIVLHLFI